MPDDLPLDEAAPQPARDDLPPPPSDDGWAWVEDGSPAASRLGAGGEDSTAPAEEESAAPDGLVIQVTVPDGLQPGDSFRISVATMEHEIPRENGASRNPVEFLGLVHSGSAIVHPPKYNADIQSRNVDNSLLSLSASGRKQANRPYTDTPEMLADFGELLLRVCRNCPQENARTAAITTPEPTARNVCRTQSSKILAPNWFEPDPNNIATVTSY